MGGTQYLGTSGIFVAAVIALILSEAPVPPMGIEFEDEEPVL